MQLHVFSGFAEDDMVVGRSTKPLVREKNHED